MSSAKEIKIYLKPKPEIDKIIKKLHYSGKVCVGSQLNFGVYLRGILIGGLQFGKSIDIRRTGPTIGCGMHDYLELNRMAIADVGIKNVESRSISYCLNFIKKNYPFIKAVLSFADATQCGDGTIYRASGFKLIQINKNKSILKVDDELIAKKSLDHVMLSNGKYLSSLLKSGTIADKTLNDFKLPNGKSALSLINAKPMPGFQFKYVYYFDKEIEAKQKFIPFSEIPKEAKMYLGIGVSSKEIVASGVQPEEEGANPIDTLQNSNEIKP
ncbi:MAG: hypothetical protein BWZ03_00130 [bacterium ADurb.BinA186]|nr:MAG: hypothetical protein BWZ03_00130 [bacterium ADurb.BinA186]